MHWRTEHLLRSCNVYSARKPLCKWHLRAPCFTFLFPANSCRFRATGCCWKWKSGILRTVMEWTHQTPLVWHSSLSFPQSQVGPTFCARNMPFPCAYACLWDWEMLRTIFNCNWVSSVEFSWLRVVWCPQTSLVPSTWGYFLCCLSVWLWCANLQLVCLNVCGNSCMGLCFTGTGCDVHNTQNLRFPSGQLLTRSDMLSGLCPEAL